MISELGRHALAYADQGWHVLPLHPSKRPYLARGLRAATCDSTTIERWWSMVPSANIGVVVPAGCIVVDVDPRSGGEAGLRLAEDALGPLPRTRTALSGRSDGGRHLYFDGAERCNVGRLALDGNAVEGVDIRLAERSYVVAPPSIHAATNLPYAWVDAEQPLARLPRAWADALTRRAPEPRVGGAPGMRALNKSRASDFVDALVTWDEILGPLGWTRSSDHGAVSRWCRPGKSNGVSATTNYNGTDRLFVFSSAGECAPFEPGRSYSKFQALAFSQHGGDFSETAAACRALRIRKALIS